MSADTHGSVAVALSISESSPPHPALSHNLTLSLSEPSFHHTSYLSPSLTPHPGTRWGLGRILVSPYMCGSAYPFPFPRCMLTPPSSRHMRRTYLGEEVCIDLKVKGPDDKAG